MEKKLFIKLENLFIYDQNDPVKTLYIPELEIYKNLKAAFYISEKNDVLNFYNLYNGILKNKEVLLSLFEYESSSYKIRNVLHNKKDVFDEISVFNLSDIIKEKDNDIPLFSIWNICSKMKPSKKEKDIFKLLSTNLKITLKNVFFNIIASQAEKIIALNNDFLKEINIHYSKIKNKQVVIKDELIQIHSHLNEITREYQNNLFEVYIEIIKDLFEKYYLLQENYFKTEVSNQKDVIKHLEKELYYLKLIDSKSMQYVINDIKIKNYQYDLYFFKDYAKQIKYKSSKFLKRTLKDIKVKISTLKFKQSLIINKKGNKEFEFLEKQILAYEKIAHTFKTNFKKIAFLSENDLWNLKNIMEQEADFFVQNMNFSYKKNLTISYKSALKLFIFNELSFSLDKWIIHSYNKMRKIQKTIKDTEAQIKELKNKKIENKITQQNKLDILNTQEKLNLAKAEYKWSEDNQKKLFNNLIKNKQNRLKRLVTNVKKTKKEIFFILKKFTSAQIVTRNNFHKHQSNIFDEYSSSLTKFMQFSFYEELLTNFYNFTLDNLESEKFNKYFLTLQRFYKCHDAVSVANANYLIAYKEQKEVDKIKLKLSQFYLDETSLLIIKDSNNINEYTRNEFMRVLSKIMDMNDLTPVFISENLDFILENFDLLYIFSNNTIIEKGPIELLSRRQIHPFSQKLFIQKHNNALPFTKEFWIRNIQNQIDHKFHTVYGNSDEIVRWSMSSSNLIKKDISKLDENVENNSTNELISYYYGKEINISNIDPNIVNKNANPKILEDLIEASSKTGEIDFNNEDIY